MENKHYVEIADKYNTQLFYNDTKYINWIISKIIPIFSISYTLSQSNIIIADIGGGTLNNSLCELYNLAAESAKHFR